MCRPSTRSNIDFRCCRVFSEDHHEGGQQWRYPSEIKATALGAAIDNNGVVYSFNYANHFSVDVPPGEFPQQIRMTDHFNLNGEGKANQMQVGFVIVGTIDASGDVFPWDTETINIRGDAFNCDPI